jgi:hypothetical protein
MTTRLADGYWSSTSGPEARARESAYDASTGSRCAYAKKSGCLLHKLTRAPLPEASVYGDETRAAREERVRRDVDA